MVGVATAVTSAIIGSVAAVSTPSSRLIQEVRRHIEKMISRCFTWFTNCSILKTQYVLRYGFEKYLNLLKNKFIYKNIGKLKDGKKILSSFHINSKLAECFAKG